MQDISKRFDNIEERLFIIEQRLGIVPPPPVAPSPVARSSPAATPQAPVVAHTPAVILPVKQAPAPVPEPISPTNILGWCAGLTFLLAISYFLNLVYASGWLTPGRQLGLAYGAAVLLVMVGLVLERRDHQYASYLPAFGLVGLYITSYADHLYYHLLSLNVSVGLVSITTLLGIWLGRTFANSFYTIFAAIGIYICPMLIHSAQPDMTSLVIFYTAWSLLFSFCALQEARRLTYVVPMYLAILGFDLAWRNSGARDEWLMAACYQLVQFLIFAGTTAAFSIRHRHPLQGNDTLAHGLALIIFYGIEYTLLKQNVPELVNYIAVISAVIVFAIYFAAQKLYEGEEHLKAGATLVASYCSLVAVHAVYFGIIPSQWMPWAALLVPAVYAMLLPKLEHNKPALFPVGIACLGVLAFGYISLTACILLKEPTAIPMPVPGLLCYVALLYAMYYYFSQPAHARAEAVVTLYAGHLALLACLVNIVERDVYLSAIWAVYAIGLLLLAIRIRNKEVGQSALLIFTASGLKVLLFDLHDSNSLVRVIVLLALSISLYVGGWLYQSLGREIDHTKAA